MGLFKKNNNISGCLTCSLRTSEDASDINVKINESIKTIKVLGAGCPSCHKQYEYVQEVVKKLNMNVAVIYVTELDEVIPYGVMSMPSLVINEQVVVEGKLLKPKALEKLLTQ